MKKKSSITEKIIFSGIMIALSVVLSKLVSINLSFLRIGFGFLPIIVLAILYGPILSGIAYSIADVIGAFLFPTGPYFPGFTATAFLTGILFGFILFNKKITFPRALLASASVCVICNLLLNTFWLTFVLGKGFWILLTSRAVKELFAIPVFTLLIIVLDKTVIKGIKNMRIN